MARFYGHLTLVCQELIYQTTANGAAWQSSGHILHKFMSHQEIFIASLSPGTVTGRVYVFFPSDKRNGYLKKKKTHVKRILSLIKR